MDAEAGRPVQRSRTIVDSLKSRANLGIAGGIIVMLAGSGMARGGEEGLLTAIVVFHCGWAWFIWGCASYMRWKGYSGWFGLFGYLLLLGILILACFPNKRQRTLAGDERDTSGPLERMSQKQEKPGHLFLLGLVPLGVLLLGLVGMNVFLRWRIDAAEWTKVAPAGMGFQALMPGTPRVEQNSRETPAGNVEVHKYTVQPKGNKELFMIVSIRFPSSVGDQFGGPEAILQLGRKDLLTAAGGEVKSERRIELSGAPGLELEILRPKGAVLKARIYARKAQVFQIWAGVPRIRATSEDVEKFLDSFQFVRPE